MPKDPKRKSTQFKPLTVQQEAYCQEYVKCPENQTQAAINAGYSPNTAGKFASQNMRDARIQKRIAELMEDRNKRLRVSADYVLLRLVEIDQMDVLDILNDDGGMKPIAEWPKVWRTSLSAMDIATIKTTQASLQKENGEADLSVEDVEHILKKVKWPDKVKNLELIGKHVDVNAFKERLEVSGTVTIADRIAAARRRVKEQAGGEE
ncbi:terminase small subunit [Klebsiella oxytoca]|uniref:Terminase small subunit n=2 Tax=Klebsiella TaxID=570 RepID=A0AAI9GW24_KLEOX|nr:terminase small subunit [Klebsiella oxytoca]ELM5279777.1 terminase small subunit [Klebsiella oxytoca]MBZ7278759.1 terminase small subunit [Klebsiella oxytoca]MBZ7717234.1 terminase small subunit [Klebsiella oxytoca]MCW9654049.1 terminase small subunit [Klebsiella oxytoca]MDM4107305.1 terminase small subunit [Klebsiella oxytoca]